MVKAWRGTPFIKVGGGATAPAAPRFPRPWLALQCARTVRQSSDPAHSLEQVAVARTARTARNF